MGVGARGRSGAVSGPRNWSPSQGHRLGSEKHAALLGARALQRPRPPGALNPGASPHYRGRVQPGRAGGQEGKGWGRRSRNQADGTPANGDSGRGTDLPAPPVGRPFLPPGGRGGTPGSGRQRAGWRLEGAPRPSLRARAPPKRPTRGLPLWGAAARAAQGSVQTARPAATGDAGPGPARYSRWLHGSGLRAARRRARDAGLDLEGWRGRQAAGTGHGKRDSTAQARRSEKPVDAAASPGELAPGAFQTGQSVPACGEGAGPQRK